MSRLIILCLLFCLVLDNRLNVVYTCTEDIEENGQILAYEIHPDGSLTEIGRVDAGKNSNPTSYNFHLIVEINKFSLP